MAITLRQAAIFRSPDSLAWIMTLGALIPVIWLLIHGQFNILSFAFVLLALVITTFMSKTGSICIILAYLFLLGDIRRMIGSFLGFPKFDLLLLAGPIVTILLALPILLRLRLKDSISKTMVALMAVMLLEVVNPRQGSLAVGLGGAMFYVIPLLWFWIGREYGTAELLTRVLYKVLLPLSVLAAIFGLLQTYVGFFPWEQAWINAVAGHFHALYLGNGLIRAFGYSVNGIEFINLLLTGSVLVAAAFFAGRRSYGLLFPPLVFMLFLSSSRTSIVKLIFAMAAAWALSTKGGKGWAVRLPFALVVLVGVLTLGLSRASSGGSEGSGTAASTSTQHQVEGLSHPLDQKKSTAGLHAAYFWGGIKEGFIYPIGNGLGAGTSGTKLGEGGGSASEGETTANTEVDFSDCFVSLGLIGGILYISVAVLVIRRSLTFGRTAPKYLGLPTLAILASVIGGWIALGQYGMGPLIWFIIGALVRNTDQKPVSVRNPRPTAVLMPPRFQEASANARSIG